MNNNDLQQMKEVVRDVVKEEVNKRVEESEGLITSAIVQGFDDVHKEFDNINKKLDTKANESTVLSWGDGKIIPLENDMDKLKYLHKDEWKKLPDSGTVSRELAENGMKV